MKLTSFSPFERQLRMLRPCREHKEVPKLLWHSQTFLTTSRIKLLSRPWRELLSLNELWSIVNHDNLALCYTTDDSMPDQLCEKYWQCIMCQEARNAIITLIENETNKEVDTMNAKRGIREWQQHAIWQRLSSQSPKALPCPAINMPQATPREDIRAPAPKFLTVRMADMPKYKRQEVVSSAVIAPKPHAVISRSNRSIYTHHSSSFSRSSIENKIPN
jgi:hypothetical protein